MTHLLKNSLIQKTEYKGLIENSEDNDIEDGMEITSSKRKENNNK